MCGVSLCEAKSFPLALGGCVIRIAVIDGQGGGIGTTIIKRIKEVFGEGAELWALGTNAIATAQMLKAGANRGATGENAIRHSVAQVEVVIGTIAILLSNAMMGEMTPGMVRAIGETKAVKLILPLTQEPIAVVGAIREPLPHMVDRLISEHLSKYVTSKDPN
jgi:NAD(P)-dependent dehydrogenase (short-subunit alcohol dehydrogenase family)